MIKKITSLSLMFVLVFATLLSPLGAKDAYAASVTSFSVTLTREADATAGNQTVLFTTPTGIANDATLILTYNNSTSIHASLDYTDIDLSYDTTPDGVCETGDTEVTLAGTPGASTYGAVRTSSTVLTFTAQSSGTAIAAGSEICIQIGTHATAGATGDQQITNGSAGTTLLVLSGTFGDSGTAAMPIIDNDQVVITATVTPTITFSISDLTVGFGTLSASQATWATGDTNGSATDTVAHTLAVATNASGGYAVTYNGATLTSGSDTIDVASINGDANGTPGTEEFGLSISTDGDATIASGYNHADPDWTWVASTTTTIASETGPTATETISARYIANIAGDTEAGSYSTTVTYIATGTF